MNNKFKKITVALAILCFAVFTLFVLWCSWENWSGAREWQKTKTLLAEQGIELDFKKLHPPMPPENQNFARTPLIAAVTDFEQPKVQSLGDSFDAEVEYQNPKMLENFREMKMPKFKVVALYPSWSSGTTAKLKVIQKLLAKEANADIENQEWMNQFETQFAELDSAANRVHSQITIDTGDSFIEHVSVKLPFLQDFMKLQKLQTFRACVALEAGDYRQARSALQTSIQLYHTSVSHPALINHLVGISILNQSLSMIWQGLESGQWREEDLVWIQQQTGDLEILSNLEKSLTYEMIVFQIGSANFLKAVSLGDSRALVTLIGAIDGDSISSSSPLGLLAMVAPSGIWDHNKALGARVMVEEMILPIRERRLPQDGALHELLRPRNFHNFLPSLTLPGISGLATRSFEAATAVDLARIACAVELYQMKNGNYPDSLNELKPDFMTDIPEDLMAPGKPLTYKKGAEGDRYRIYSIGTNGTDDGGRVVFRSKRSPRRKSEEGDWAWGYRYRESQK